MPPTRRHTLTTIAATSALGLAALIEFCEELG